MNATETSHLFMVRSYCVGWRGADSPVLPLSCHSSSCIGATRGTSWHERHYSPNLFPFAPVAADLVSAIERSSIPVPDGHSTRLLPFVLFAVIPSKVEGLAEEIAGILGSLTGTIVSGTPALACINACRPSDSLLI